MAKPNKRPARTRVKKTELLARSRELDNVSQTNEKEEVVINANTVTPFRMPKRPPILPSDDLQTCIIKYMSDGDEYSIDEMATLMCNVTPNIEAVPRIMMAMFKDGTLTDRKEVAEGKTTYYYTLKQGTNVNLQSATESKKEPTTYNIDYALFSIMLDNKKHTAAELLQAVHENTGFPRNLIDQRLNKLMFRSDIDRMGKGKSTTYSLKKGITMDKLVKEEPAPSPLSNVSAQVFAELGNKFKVTPPKNKKEPEVPADMVFRKLTDAERLISADDSIDLMIWKAMYGNGYLTIIETMLVVREYGKSDTTVRNHFNELIKKDWFHQELRGRRNVRHFCLKGDIPAPEPEVLTPAVEAAVQEELVIDTRPAIWINDVATRCEIPVIQVVRRLPEFGILESANQMIPAFVADKIFESINPDDKLAGISLPVLARELDVPFTTLRAFDRKINGNGSLTVAGLRNLRQCEDLKELAGSVTIGDLAEQLGVGTGMITDYFLKKSNRMANDETILPKATADEIRQLVEAGTLAFSTAITDLALELRIPIGSFRVWLKNNGHIKDDTTHIDNDLAGRIRVDPEMLEELTGAIVVGDLAVELGVTPSDVIKTIMGFGQIVTIGSVLGMEVADKVREKFPKKPPEADMSQIKVVVEESREINTKLANNLVAATMMKDILSNPIGCNTKEEVQHAISTGSGSFVDITYDPKNPTIIQPVKSRKKLKVTVEIGHGIFITVEEAEDLAIRLKAIGLNESMVRAALTSDQVLEVSMKIKGIEFSTTELFELLQELDEAGFGED